VVTSAPLTGHRIWCLVLPSVSSLQGRRYLAPAGCSVNTSRSKMNESIQQRGRPGTLRSTMTVQIGCQGLWSCPCSQGLLDELDQTRAKCLCGSATDRAKVCVCACVYVCVCMCLCMSVCACTCMCASGMRVQVCVCLMGLLSLSHTAWCRA
jgi:hypothetical protein